MNTVANITLEEKVHSLLLNVFLKWYQNGFVVVHLFIHSFSIYSYYVPGVAVSAEHTAMNKTNTQL